jgi:glycosyltransferase involved in cell wall biosynthesis
MRFIHFKPDRIAVGYDTLSIARIRKLAAVDPAPNGAPFASRHFTIIARFVPKKNLSTALVAYSLYVQKTKSPRPLHLCGSGELEAALNEQVEVLGLQGLVFFRGFLSAQEIAGTLANTLALLLVSKEEQFGLAVIEAQAMGVPVIYTRACGARDELLRSGVNGFLVEANNPPGIAYFMTLIASDEPLWRKLAKGTLESAYRGDVGRFVEGVEQLRSLGKQH